MIKRFALIFTIFILIIANLLTFAFSIKLEIYTPNYFNEQNNIYKPIHFLPKEELNFKFCLSENMKNPEIFISEGTKNEGFINISYLDFSDEPNCFYSYYDLTKIQNNRFDLILKYQENNIEKEIRRGFLRQKESSASKYVLENDYNDLSALNLSYYLFVLNNIESIYDYENQQIYEKLKQLRNNDFKCWPKDKCNLTQTANILYNLKEAGYDKSSRLIEDGRLYMEKNIIESPLKYENQQIIKNSDTYDFEVYIKDSFTNPTEIDCNVIVDKDKEKSIIYDSSDKFTDTFLRSKFTKEIEVVCNRKVDEISIFYFADKIENRNLRDFKKYEFTVNDKYYNQYSSIKYKFQIDNNMTTTEEIKCDINIDGTNKKVSFNKNTNANNLFFEGEVKEKVAIECDKNVENAYFYVYGNIEDESYKSNTDSLYFNLQNADMEKYKFDIELNSNKIANEIKCDLSIDARLPRHFVFNTKNTDRFSINGYKASSKIQLKCDNDVDKIILKIYDAYDRIQVYEEKINVKNMDYSINSDFLKYYCIGTDNICDYDASIISLIVYGNDIKNSDKIKKYLNSVTHKTGINDKKVSDKNEFIDSGMFLIYNKDQEIINFLKYNQNNDGSWGNAKSFLFETSWAILGLQSNDAGIEEYIDDGIKWIYYNEPDNGWGSISSNSLAFLASKKNHKPYVTIDIDSDTYEYVMIINVTNPSIYNLKDLTIGFSSNIEGFLHYKQNLGNLNTLQSTISNISISKDLLGSITGYVFLNSRDKDNNKNELLKIPITIFGEKAFVFENNDYAITNDDMMVNFYLKSRNIEDNLTCFFINPFSTLREKFIVDSNFSKLSLFNPQLETGVHTLNFECSKDDGVVYKIPFKIDVFEKNKTFEIPNPEKIIVKDDVLKFSIKHLNANFDEYDFKVIPFGDFKEHMLNYSYEYENGYTNVNINFAVDSLNLINTSLKNNYIVVKNKESEFVEIKIDNNKTNSFLKKMFYLLFWFTMIGFIIYLIIYVRLKYIEYKDLKEKGMI